MNVRANISSGYLGRLALVTLVGFGFAGWALYDGLVTYPQQRDRALKYRELKKADRLGEWEAIAEEQGWPPDNPGKPHTDAEIETQFVMATIAGVVGLLFLIHLARVRGRWIEGDDEGLRTNRGELAKFTDIFQLDKKRWRKKGIAVVRYNAADGRQRKITLDDCNYEQAPTELLLRAVEAHLEPEQIVGGRAEPPREPPAEDPATEDAAEQAATPEAEAEQA